MGSTTKSERRRTVLVVDDDEDVRAVAVAALETCGFAVVEAENGRRALDLIDSRPDLDIVVTDVVMPGLSGLHVLRGAQQRRPDIKVLVTSAYAAGLIDGQLPRGGFLAKPFRVKDLQRAVHALLETRCGQARLPRPDASA